MLKMGRIKIGEKICYSILLNKGKQQRNMAKQPLTIFNRID